MALHSVQRMCRSFIPRRFCALGYSSHRCMDVHYHSLYMAGPASSGRSHSRLSSRTNRSQK
ncbi:hypothetical protein [Rubritalea tangerina]|uniref:hypothetical protein n=1 Tax=Rubritalea tangerina TaxID=430798 RepID=UPI003620374C